MMDQAEKLRKIIDNIRKGNSEDEIKKPEDTSSKMSRVLAITSGKGGVGKTNITVNLAVSLSELGYRVAVLDADFGLANIDVLLGIIPKYNLVDVIKSRRNILEALCEGPGNIKFISGGSGVEELTKLDNEQLLTFIKNIALLDKLTDIILIDTAAGISENVMSFLLAADEVFLITTPEPTSITDAYALIKLISKKEKDKKVKVIVNRAENQKEANEIFDKLSGVSKRFLSMELENFGFVHNDDAVPKAVRMQKPFSISFPRSMATKTLKEISKKIVEQKKEENGASVGMKNFINKLLKAISV